MVTVNFYSPNALQFPASILFLPVSLMIGKYVHADIDIAGVRWTADISCGVRAIEKINTPTTTLEFPWISDKMADVVARALEGERYSRKDMLSVWLPYRWKHDHRGLICSELVAQVLMRSADEARKISKNGPAANCRCLSDLIWSIEPHRMDPSGLHTILSRFLSRTT